jgi:uncharacterized protein (UPF0335 family)
MKKTAVLTVAFIGLGSLVLAASDLKVEKKEDIQKTYYFQDAAKPGKVAVDNIFGSIKAEGYDGKAVQLKIRKTIKARNEEKALKAQKEVELKVTEESNTIDIYVDGPFRCQYENRRGVNWKDPGYEVHYDFEIKVPRRTDLCLKTVNDGDISVRGVEGGFEIHNVNGRIEMLEIAGSGDAHTVNGKVEATFIRKPDAACSFETVNGELKVSFPDNLAADFRLKTFNGEIYTDFPVTSLPLRASTQERNGTKFVYKSDLFFGVRVAKGGPEILMETLNGDIYITKNKI